MKIVFVGGGSGVVFAMPDGSGSMKMKSGEVYEVSDKIGKALVTKFSYIKEAEKEENKKTKKGGK